MTTPAPTPGLANLTSNHGGGEDDGLVRPSWSHARNNFHYTQSSRPVAETQHEDATAEQIVVAEQQKIAVDLANSVNSSKSHKKKVAKSTSRRRTPVKSKRLTKVEQRKLATKKKKQLVIARKKKAALKKKKAALKKKNKRKRK
jgi:hypothetical protein